MAIDKLVDSTALDAGLTSIADAIRTKGGTSAPLSFPDGMAAAVAAIPTGTDYTQYIMSASDLFYNAAVLPQTMSLTMPNVTSLYRMFGRASSGTSGLQDITITVPGNVTLNVERFAMYHRGIKTITFTNGVKCGAMYGFVAYANDLTHIYGELDLSEATATAYGDIFRATNLSHVRFKPNCIAKNWPFQYGSFDADTLVSLANAFVAGEHTSTWASGYKTAAQSTHGSIDTSGDYAVFTRTDDPDDPTLDYFITQVKGWTIA